MNEWQKVRCGDIFKIKHGFAFKGEHFSDAHGAIVLTPGNFEAGGGLKLRPGKDRSYTADFPLEFRLQAQDLLVVMTDLTQEAAILGAPALVPENLQCLHNQRLGKIINVDEGQVDWQFLYYVFNTYEYREHLRATATGSTVKHTSPSRIYEHKINLPPLPTQRRIASILKAYDDLIEVNRRRIAVLEEMARGLFDEWFVRFRFPDHEAVPILDTPDGPLPEGWRRSTVKNLVRRVPIKTRYSQKTALAEGLVPILDQGKSGIIGYHNDEPSVGANLDHPVIVFANHTCYQKVVHFPFSAIQNVLPFLPSKAAPQCVYWLHHATTGLVELNDYKGHWPEFMSKAVAVPPTELAEEFERFAKPLHMASHNLQRQQEKLAVSRDLLLPRLISGQLSVAEAERQPEEEA